MGEYGTSPWSVNCLEDFLYYCCPECDTKDHSKENFLQHAFEKHPEAKDILSMLSGINVKKEIVDDVVEYDFPYNENDTIDGTLCFPKVFNCQKIGIKRDIHGWLRIDVGNAGLLSKYPNLVEATPFLAKN